MAKRTCTIDGCEGPCKVKMGLCGKHYSRWKRHGDPLKTVRRTGCAIDGCQERHRARGLCSKHYEANRGPHLPGTSGTKCCCACDEEKPVSEFHRQSKAPDGLNYRCKSCLAAYYKVHYRENVEKYAANRQRWRAENPHKSRDYYLKRYGLDGQSYDALLEAQGGACAICGTTEPRGQGAFHVDHDHDTGKIRGLLCHPCNVGIGSLQDSPRIMELAAAYLRAHAS